MATQFKTALTVRMFEIDAQGHLTGSAYLDYANQALWELLRAAGVDTDAMIASGIGPVNLETTIRYRSELRAGERVELTCDLSFGEGKTYKVTQVFLNERGALSAEVSGVYGLLDLVDRRLIDDPASIWRRLAARPEKLGLDGPPDVESI